MAQASPRGAISRLITGASTTPVEQFRIVTVDPTNAGSVQLSTAAQLGFVGVTGEPTDALGYAQLYTDGIVQIRAGGAITAGDNIASDATGKAVKITPNPSGTAAKQCCGVAMNTVAVGGLVDVLLQPCIVEG